MDSPNDHDDETSVDFVVTSRMNGSPPLDRRHGCRLGNRVKWIGLDLGIPFAVAAAIALSLTLALLFRERRRLSHYRAHATDYLIDLASHPAGETRLLDEPEFYELNNALRAVEQSIKRKYAAPAPRLARDIPSACPSTVVNPARTAMTKTDSMNRHRASSRCRRARARVPRLSSRSTTW